MTDPTIEPAGPTAEPTTDPGAPLHLADETGRVWVLPAPNASTAVWWHRSSKLQARAGKDAESLTDDEVDKILRENTLGKLLGEALADELENGEPVAPISVFNGLINSKVAWFSDGRAAAIKAWDDRNDPPAANREERRAKAKKKSR